MSLITSCPSCGTMFRVVPDQLKISEGWVRCGHCSEVFDATAHLSDESVLGNLPDAQGTVPADLGPRPAPPPPAPAPTPAATPAPTAPPVRPRRTAVPAPVDARRPAAAPAAEAQTADRSTDPSDFYGEDSHSLEPSPLDAPFVFRRSEINIGELENEPAPGRESQMLPEDFERDEPDPIPDVSFVRQGRRRAFWRRPFVRLVLTLLLLALGAGLAGQMAYQDRDRLALAHPSLRPVLLAMCDVLGCTLGPPRQIEAIVIDSSGFNRLRSDTYKLSFTLRNSAPVPVAAPAMELTVTDAQDQTLVRRVLTPDELGAPNHAIPPSGEWSRTVGVVLDTGGSARVAGYRLLAFYP